MLPKNYFREQINKEGIERIVGESYEVWNIGCNFVEKNVVTLLLKE